VVLKRKDQRPIVLGEIDLLHQLVFQMKLILGVMYLKGMLIINAPVRKVTHKSTSSVITSLAGSIEVVT